MAINQVILKSSKWNPVDVMQDIRMVLQTNADIIIAKKLDFSRFLSIIKIPNRKRSTTININMSGCKESGCMTQMQKVKTL